MNRGDLPGSKLERCCYCEEPLLVFGTRYCSRTCRSLMAEFWSFSVLGFILENARWAGAPTQEECLREYLHQRMTKAMRRLNTTSDALAEVLIEIVQIQEEEAIA
jgi:hypothetical protein